MTLLPNKLRTAHKVARRVATFRREEDGGFIIFTLYLFIMMLMIGGLAVDMMRYEVTRSRIQNTLDRAILAAADLDQQLPPAQVVQNYFDINGMSQFLNAPTNVTGGLNYRTVNAHASATVPMMFANMLGIETMDTVTSATATESVEDIEISLVLDVSGSMGWNNKLEEMQEAAKDFVEIIYSQAEYEDISISIIPYSTQVNVGLNLLQEFNVQWQHDESTCVDFDSSDFEEPSIRTTHSIAHAAHFDPWYYWGPLDRGSNRLPVCRDDSQSEILALSNVEQDLNDHIDALTAGGNTSIEIGVKWGTALLHHDAQPAVTGLIADTVVSSHFAGRPYTTSSGASLKIMVVMTDGINTSEYRLIDSLRNSWSDARVDPETGHYYIRSDESGDRDGDGDWNEDFFVPHLYFSDPRGDYWRDNNDGVHDPNDDYFAGDDDDDDGDGFAYDDDMDMDDSDYDPNSNKIYERTTKLRYDELYDRVSLRYHAWYHKYAQFWDSDDFYYWADDVTWTVNGSTKDTYMSNICAEARAYSVTIYTIGFEVTDDSAVVLEDCASSPAHFYRVAGEEIGDAFRSIARQVNELRLIQ